MLRRAVKSASRTFEVLELFAEVRRPLRLNEIYTSLGYPQSSTTNLLKSMVMSGYLNYNRSTRTYLPTPRVSALGNWLPNYIQADNRYRRLVDELQKRTDETVALATQNDLFIQYIFLKSPSHEFKMPPPEGTMRLMVDSSSGLALMCAMSTKQIDTICRYTNYYQLTQERKIVFEDVMDEVRWFRRTGHAFRPRWPSPEVSSVAIRLEETLHGIPLAIGVGGLHDRIESARLNIVKIMRDVVEEMKVWRPDDGAGPAPASQA